MTTRASSTVSRIISPRPSAGCVAPTRGLRTDCIRSFNLRCGWDAHPLTQAQDHRCKNTKCDRGPEGRAAYEKYKGVRLRGCPAGAYSVATAEFQLSRARRPTADKENPPRLCPGCYSYCRRQLKGPASPSNWCCLMCILHGREVCDSKSKTVEVCTK
jgi:hypothetical protein